MIHGPRRGDFLDTNKSRDILNEILQEMDDFASMKSIAYPPIYLLGGSGCIVAGYLDRATTDIDLIDMEYDASMGRILRILENYDFLDLFLTTIPEDFASRTTKIKQFKNIYVLSKEDIILSKIGRYSLIDQEDISHLLVTSDTVLLLRLAIDVTNRSNISERIKQVFVKNFMSFRKDFDV